jgi:predicted PurR-regulated permease PerM
VIRSNVINDVKDNTLQIPPPSPAVAEWPVVGKKVYGVWSQAHADLPSLVQSMQPKIGDLSKKALRMVASIGVSIVMFLFSFIIAGIIMAFGESGAQSIRAIFDRIVGTARGEFTPLHSHHSGSRQGVIGVASIHAIIVGPY